MRANEVLKILDISRKTLYRYTKQGLIKIDATINGQYRYNAESVFKLLNKDVPDEFKNK
jgi:predicted site-specific integrase-resolvase